jgi:hypothetical protein
MNTTKVLLEYNDFICMNHRIKEIMGSVYDKQQKRVIYQVQYVEYLDHKD